jgi:hypothetical protein
MIVLLSTFDIPPSFSFVSAVYHTLSGLSLFSWPGVVGGDGNRPGPRDCLAPPKMGDFSSICQQAGAQGNHPPFAVFSRCIAIKSSISFKTPSGPDR